MIGNLREELSQENIEVAAMIIKAKIMVFFMRIEKFEKAWNYKTSHISI
jgi:hypothetical protein